MKKTILVPNIIEPHFEVMANVLRSEGYSVEIMPNYNLDEVINEGLASVHNDMCYPAILIIGQFLVALKSKKYDLDNITLLVSQTGGGCRASNYINLLRRALDLNGFNNVKVLSFNNKDLDKDALKVSKSTFIKFLLSIYYSDLIMILYNQTRPYEVQKGESKEIYDYCVKFLKDQNTGLNYFKFNKIFKEIVSKFATIKLSSEEKIKVGLAGEIYMKYSPLANNNLYEYLIDSGVEVVSSGIGDFIMYCINDNIIDKKLYGVKTPYFISKVVINLLNSLQSKMMSAIKKYSNFRPLSTFKEIKEVSKDIISEAVAMGEGWLMSAEMADLAKHKIYNIICAQPFGCLPSHIIAKGVIRKIKQNYELANIVVLDYDASTSKVNQENRIKLMLSNATSCI